jgi:integrase
LLSFYVEGIKMAAITKSPTGSYNVRIRSKGFPIVCKTFHSLKDAQAWGKRVESDQQAGRWVQASPTDHMTLRAALVRYSQDVTSLKKGAAQETCVIGAMCREPITTTAMTAINSGAIARLRDDWLKTLAPATVRRRLAILSHCYEIARKEWSVTAGNPVADIRKPAVSNARDRRLFAGEFEAILAATESDELIPIASLAIETAMRLSEIVGLRWADISLTSRTAALRDSKNGRPRVVPLSHGAVAVLAGLPRRIDGGVFGTPGPAISKAWRRAVARARLNYSQQCLTASNAPLPAFLVGIHFHDLRHEATSRLFERGTFNTMEVAAITGHRTLQMLSR